MAKKNKEFQKLERKRVKRPGRHAKSPNKSYTRKKSRGQG
jgi:hypothetical protein